MLQNKCINQCRRLFPVLLVLLSLIVVTYTVSSVPQGRVQEPEDPYNRINGVLLEGGKIKQVSSGDLPREAFTTEIFPRKQADYAVKEYRAEKIHPLLKERLEEGADAYTEEIIVTFRDDLEIPRFPIPEVHESRDSEANRQALARAASLVKQIKQERANHYQAFARSMAQRDSFEVRDTFWLINGVSALASRATIRQLAAREDVLYIEPVQGGEMPPADTNPNNDLVDGRAMMNSDPYFNLGQTGGFIGLLDTGVRFTHTVFNNPSHIAFRYDCVNGGGNCILSGTGYNPSDPTCWFGGNGHGTQTAGIITGNANLGNDFRGVSGVTLDSFKVYPNNCGGLDTNAVIKAFEKAVAVLDRVIVAEMQAGGSDTSAISNAADKAFDAGAVIIAANGNNGPAAGTVNAPANAHKVIGVGAVDVQTGAQYAGQSRGPAPDGRFKPDIQAPNNAETASNLSDTERNAFGGTSGATPFAAGAAALLRNFLRGASFSIDPGQVYAQMILSGQHPYPFDNTSGAGVLRLPTDGFVWWGKTTVTNGGQVDIPLPVSGVFPNTLDGALWWPETPAQTHNDVDLSLVDPSGVARASSISISSVFERARVSGTVTPGTWILRIRGFSVTGSQTVYWAAHVRTS